MYTHTQDMRKYISTGKKKKKVVQHLSINYIGIKGKSLKIYRLKFGCTNHSYIPNVQKHCYSKCC